MAIGRSCFTFTVYCFSNSTATALPVCRAFQEANPDTVEQRSHPVLAPVNIDVEEGDIRVRDSFCWNIYGTLLLDVAVHTFYSNLLM